MNLDRRYIEQAEGYLALELPAPALESLARVSPEGREENAFDFHWHMGEALRGLQRYADAIPHLLAARDLKPAEAAAALMLGWCCKRADRLEQAIEVLLQAERAQRMRGGSSSALPIILYNLSCYYSLAGQRTPMLRYLAEALELHPHFRDEIPEESDFDRFRNDPDFVRLSSVIV